MEALLLSLPPSYLSSGYPFWGPLVLLVHIQVSCTETFASP